MKFEFCIGCFSSERAIKLIENAEKCQEISKYENVDGWFGFGDMK